MAIASSLVIVKEPSEVTMQGIKIYSLWLAVIVIGVAFFGTALGLAHIVPIGRLVAGTSKTGIINKGLCQINRMAIAFLPVTA